MTNNTKNAVKKTVKTTANVAGKVGRVAVGGALILGHVVLSVIGAILCAVTSQD